MQYLFLFCVIVVLYDVGSSLPTSQIIRYVNDLNDNGYHFDFESSDGIRRSETGDFIPVPNNEPNLRVSGEYGYYLPDGTPISVTYTASEDGYRPRVVIGKTAEPQIVSSPIPSSAIASLAGGGLG